MKNKDQDLMKIKTDLQLVSNEQASLETRISSRKMYLNEMTNSLKSVEGEISKVGNFFVKELSQ